jgi:hypothetical protein
MSVASANGRARWLDTDGKDVGEGLAALRRHRRLEWLATRAAGAASAAPTRTEEPRNSPSPARTTPRTTSQLNSRAVCVCDMGDDRPLSIRGARVEADPPDGTGGGLDAVATSVSLPVSAASDGTVTMVGLVGRPRAGFAYVRRDSAARERPRAATQPGGAGAPARRTR